MENKPGLDKNILEILIGIKTKQDEKEEQLRSNARYILPTLTIKDWTTWCELINSGNIKRKIENEMEHHMIYEPIENLDYIIRKILRQEYRQHTTKYLNKVNTLEEHIEGLEHDPEEWKELNKMYILYSYGLDLEEDDILFYTKK